MESIGMPESNGCEQVIQMEKNPISMTISISIYYAISNLLRRW